MVLGKTIMGKGLHEEGQLSIVCAEILLKIFYNQYVMIV